MARRLVVTGSIRGGRVVVNYDARGFGTLIPDESGLVPWRPRTERKKSRAKVDHDLVRKQEIEDRLAQ